MAQNTDNHCLSKKQDVRKLTFFVIPVKRVLANFCQILLAAFLWILFSGSEFFVSCSSSEDNEVIDSLINQAPVASNSAFVTTVNVAVSGFLQARDNDGDRLTYKSVEDPSIGFVQINPLSGAFTYVSNLAGSDSFAFKANDGVADSNTAIVTVTINRATLSWEKMQAQAEQEAARALRGASRVSNPGLPPEWASAFANDPFNPRHFLAYASNRGLQRSTDSGATWTTLEINPLPASENMMTVITFSEFVTDLVYIAVNRQVGGNNVLRSTDGGSTWRLISESKGGKIVELTSGPLRADGGIELYARAGDKKTLYRAIDYPY